MAIVDLIMPKLGESITEAIILKWLKNPGDTIHMDETLLEIATDKVDSEVPSTTDGVIEELLFNVDDVVPVGAVIARIKTAAIEVVQTEAIPVSAIPVTLHNIEITEETEASVVSSNFNKVHTNSNRFYSPLVLNIAANEGVSLSELETISGSGNEVRVTKKDILQYVADKKAGKTVQPQTKPIPHERVSNQITKTEPQPITTQHSGNVEIMEMDRMRRLIADHMVRSKQTSPHVTSFTEADVTNMVLWRNKVKNDFQKRENTKITYTPLFIEAVVKCIKKFPLINSSLAGNTIIIKKDINIGMATALPSGNLIVPVIKNADQFNLVGLSKQVNSLADNARNNKLKADDTQGGTFTMTNVGTFGSLMGTPIINQPQVAILAVGAIKKRPVVVETPHGDSIAIRHMMYLSMSYDHRIIDGSLGATFLTAVANELENFDPERDF